MRNAAALATNSMVSGRKIVLETQEIPPMPVVAAKVVRMTSDPDRVDFKELSRTIAADAALCSRIIRIANSPFFGLPTKINTLSAGIRVLGLKTIKSLVVAASVKQVYQRFGLTEKLLWEHSCAVSFLAMSLARHTRCPLVEESFLAGLLHDIGKVILNNMAPDQYGEVMRQAYNNGTPFEVVEHSLFGIDHTEAGAMVLAKWEFSELLVDIVRYHQDLDRIETWPEPQRTLGLCVALGDAISYRHMLADHLDLQDDDPLYRRPAVALGFDRERLDAFETDAKERWAQEMEAFAE
ncbi:MAG: HDOD domain-containing protein [Myxococcales bacterium]|nr:HDOD domain-containing protein [Myxococcales bacterium]